jgi:hypothetical protein
LQIKFQQLAEDTEEHDVDSAKIEKFMDHNEEAKNIYIVNKFKEQYPEASHQDHVKRLSEHRDYLDQEVINKKQRVTAFRQKKLTTIMQQSWNKVDQKMLQKPSQPQVEAWEWTISQDEKNMKDLEELC